MSLVQNWDNLTPAQQNKAIMTGLKGKAKKLGKRGKETETKTATALDLVTGVAQWSSNNWTPLCDKVVNWKGRFVLVECKETHDPNFGFSQLTEPEHLALKEVEKTHGLALILIRWIVDYTSSRCFAITYGEFIALQPKQKFKHFKLDAPDLHRWFRPFNFAKDLNLKDQGFPTELEGHVSGMLRTKARPEP